MVLPLLALTWMSAVLAVTDRRSALFQILFAVFDSLEGFVIVMVHCILRREVGRAGAPPSPRRGRFWAQREVGGAASGPLTSVRRGGPAAGAVAPQCKRFFPARTRRGLCPPGVFGTEGHRHCKRLSAQLRLLSWCPLGLSQREQETASCPGCRLPSMATVKGTRSHLRGVGMWKNVLLTRMEEVPP